MKNKNNFTREHNLMCMATDFYRFLDGIKYNLDEPIFYFGVYEALNKFLSREYIKLQNNKLNTDYISPEAYNQIITTNNTKNLIFEHMVPKNLYQTEIIKSAKNKQLYSIDQIYELLNKYWWIATITVEQDTKLTKAGLRLKMPKDWDNQNIFARYQSVGINLVENNYFNK